MKVEHGELTLDTGKIHSVRIDGEWLPVWTNTFVIAHTLGITPPNAMGLVTKDWCCSFMTNGGYRVVCALDEIRAYRLSE